MARNHLQDLHFVVSPQRNTDTAPYLRTSSAARKPGPIRVRHRVFAVFTTAYPIGVKRACLENRCGFDRALKYNRASSSSLASQGLGPG